MNLVTTAETTIKKIKINEWDSFIFAVFITTNKDKHKKCNKKNDTFV